MTDLTTLANVEAYLGLASGDAAEPLLSRLITAASAFAERYCDRRFLSTAYSVNRNGNGARVMALENAPVTAITSLSIYSTAVPAGDPVRTPGYFLVGDNRVGLHGYMFTAGLANVAISYVAGFQTVPPDVEEAVIELVALRFRERSRIGKVSDGVEGQTTSYYMRDLPPLAQSVLNTYKRVGLVA